MNDATVWFKYHGVQVVVTAGLIWHMMSEDELREVLLGTIETLTKLDIKCLIDKGNVHSLATSFKDLFDKIKN